MIAILLALGCGSPEPAELAPKEPVADQLPAKAPAPDVDRAVALAKRIDAEPARAEAILAEEDMTPEQLDELMDSIARSPEASARYAAER